MGKAKLKVFTDRDIVVQAQPDPPFPVDATDPVEPITQIVSMGDYKIERIPIPRRSGRKGIITFPIAALTPDTEDSFLVPALGEVQAKIAGSIRTYANRQGFKVVLRTEQSGVRVWRKNANKIK